MICNAFYVISKMKLGRYLTYIYSNIAHKEVLQTDSHLANGITQVANFIQHFLQLLAAPVLSWSSRTEFTWVLLKEMLNQQTAIMPINVMAGINQPRTFSKNCAHRSQLQRHGLRFWITAMATPFEILSVRLIAPYTNAPVSVFSPTISDSIERHITSITVDPNPKIVARKKILVRLVASFSFKKCVHVHAPTTNKLPTI